MWGANKTGQEYMFIFYNQIQRRQIPSKSGVPKSFIFHFLRLQRHSSLFQNQDIFELDELDKVHKVSTIQSSP